MAFIGTPLDTRNTFQSLQGKRFNGDGSTTAFTLDVAPSSTLDLEVFVGNVRQAPNSAYTLSGTTLTFTGAPPSGTNNIYVVHQAKSVGTIDPPANSVGVTELNLSDGSSGQFIKTDGSGTISFASAASALDDITTGDAASTLATSAGNITIDAQGGDTDIIFKGTDGSTDITALTIDMSDGGVLQTRAGVGFPGTQVSSSDANILDDYEEGSWTPTSASISFSSASGRYVKIGAQVTLWFTINFPSTSNSSDARITGLPFNPVSQNGQGVLGNINNTDIADVRVSADSGNSFINLRNEAGSEKTNANLSSRNIRGMITYLQAAD